MELNEIPVHEASDLKDGVDVTSALHERVSPSSLTRNVDGPASIATEQQALPEKATAI